MTSVFAIAAQTIRAAIRSRVALLIVALLVFILIGRPVAVKSDGTLLGQVQLALNYSLSVAAIMLGIVALWLGAGAISQEIDDKQLRLIVVKPVSAFRIWMGKWLGLAAMSAMMVALTGLLLYAMLAWTLRSTGDDAGIVSVSQRLLSSRRRFPSRSTVLRDSAERVYAARLAAGEVDASRPRDEVLRDIERDIARQPLGVPPGGSTVWEIPPATRPVGDDPLFLRVHFSGFGYRRVVSGVWTVQWRGGTPFTYTAPLQIRQAHEIVIPVSHFVDDAPVRVLFENVAGENATTLLFTDWQGVELLSPAGAFGANFLRALLCVFFYICMLAALGLTMGSVFSFPVAVFAAFSIMFMFPLARYAAATRDAPAHHHHEQEAHDEPSAFSKAADYVSERVVDGLDIVAHPVFTYWPMHELNEGFEVSWCRVREAALILVLGYSGVLFAFGALVLMKRELALHER